MAWRIVKCPNGRYARFTEVVDNFTHYNLSREEAVELCIEKGCTPLGAEEKVKRADDKPSRYAEELQTIKVVYGRGERRKWEALLNGTAPEGGSEDAAPSEG
jgi:hypothetical protein